MNATTENPRAVLGDNVQVDYAKEMFATLRRDYPNLEEQKEQLKTEARALYQQPTTEENKGAKVAMIKRMRDFAARVIAFHKVEKEPHYRRGQTVDQFFFSIADEIERRDRKAKPGAADHLQMQLDDYVNEQIEKQRAERERQRLEAERIAREAREKAEREQREAEEARLAAERARKPERIEEKTEVAQQLEAKADLATVEANIAGDKLYEATTAAAAKGADLVRTRLDEGAMLTARQEGYAEIEDDTKLNKDLLWPFISMDAKEKALRAWAKTGGHKVMMDGARIGHRHKAVGR